MSQVVKIPKLKRGIDIGEGLMWVPLMTLVVKKVEEKGKAEIGEGRVTEWKGKVMFLRLMDLKMAAGQHQGKSILSDMTIQESEVTK